MLSLREAWQLHPLSMSVKVDHARGHWYGGNEHGRSTMRLD